MLRSPELPEIDPDLVGRPASDDVLSERFPPVVMRCVDTHDLAALPVSARDPLAPSTRAAPISSRAPAQVWPSRQLCMLPRVPLIVRTARIMLQQPHAPSAAKVPAAASDRPLLRSCFHRASWSSSCLGDIPTVL